jgi:uncharacterized membrane protein
MSDQPSSDKSSKANAGIYSSKLLVASVASNLFLLGLLIGSWASAPWRDGPWRGGPPPRPPLQMMIQEASGKVSPEGLKKLSNLVDELEAGFRHGMSETAPLRERVREELGRQPFDVVAFTKALDAMNQAFSKDHGMANKRFAEVVATLSAKDRKQLANVRFP